MARKRKSPLVIFILIMRSVVVGVAYSLVRGVPGLTSSFVSIFVGFLAFVLIVSMPKFSLRFKYWKEMILVGLPGISSTAITLTSGLLRGVIYGGVTNVGLPAVGGLVFTLGFAYSVAGEIKGNISSYVGMISGLEMFDRIEGLDLFGEEWLQDIAGPAGQLIYGTFLALLIGWLVGILVGVVTRLFLPRGFRTLKSSAYNQPLWMRSFREVIHLDENQVLLQIELSEESPLAFKTLAETGLGREFGIQIMSIIRPPEGVINPRGSDVLLPMDQLVVLLPSEHTNLLLELTKGRVLSE